ncbi:Glucan endo-1,3-alpha-glucosidase agn1 [Recurvomyces mirabilis]|uniref:Glucan endo-1,3-alpha-glucosidase agn1 n=1 Tax=Recurvomyces mirabilis TaxID=574656 RepID=UPI002DE144B3|nr:Glucan endo-1,3-alpha-glucosidase agn1 [Recurvomyces mirabilis]
MSILVVGEQIDAAAGFASPAGAIAIVRNVALGIYDSVQDPKYTIVDMLGMLVGVGLIAKVSRDKPGIAAIANIRRSMSADDMSGLGNILKANHDKLQGILKLCRI